MSDIKSNENTNLIFGGALFVAALLVAIPGFGSGGKPDHAPAPHVAAMDMAQLDNVGRTALRGEIRAYLLDNPEVLMEAMEVLEQRQAHAQVSQDQSLVQVNHDALFNDPASWAGGNLDGDISLVEFIDYRCGYCKRAHPEVTELVESDGNIRIIRKELPILGDQSIVASRFAIAVRSVHGDDAYKSVSDALMEMRGPVNDDSLSHLSDTLGLDRDAVKTAMNSDATSKIIADNHALAQRLQIRGTPSFVMNDQMLRGYLPLEGMRAQVAKQRNEH